MRYILCKILISNSSKDLEKREINTLDIRFLSIHIIITHLSSELLTIWLFRALQL
ncbi:hypothetical protein MtrunA17_Chr7g0216501 [Medicago truncatula]|uniref:Transmembrane protein n=1 Tax=Medicago truncatula TaxID=3880 RepID=A0A396GVE3_MEDTR|nr:hypothetical protein MtrunA17_Chr7g0216501 [Medicago truncatula]